MIRYYDRRGNALPNMQAADWSDEGVRVASTALPGDVTVSTVHLVIDHNRSHAGPPLIFETLVFGGPLDGEMNRYSTEAEARAGHAEMVARVRAAHTDRDDDFGALDLDDMPAIPPLVRNARVAADVLFVDPPPAYTVRATEYLVGIQGRDEDGLVSWAQRHHLDEIDGWASNGISWREFRGVIEGVPFEVTVEVVP